MDFQKSKQNIEQASKALNQGKMPTNEQITEGLDTLQDNSSALRSNVELSQTGQEVINKTNNLIDSTKNLINQNNQEDCIQKLIYYTRKGIKDVDVRPDVSNSQQEIVEKTKEVYYNLVYTARLLVTSNEFRGLLNEIIGIIKNILYQHDFPGSKYLDNDNNLENDTQDFKNQLKDSGKNIAQGLAKQAKPLVDDASKGNFDDASKKGETKTKNLKDQSKDQFNEAKQKSETKAEEIKHKSKEIYNEGLSEDQKNRIMSKLDNIIDQLHKNREYKNAVNGLLDTLELIYQSSLAVKSQVEQKSKEEIESNKNIKEALYNAKKAVENFAGNKSLDDFIDSVYSLIKEVQNDDQLKESLNSLRDFLNKVINDPNYNKKDRYFETGSDIINDFRNKAIQNHKSSFDKVIEKLNEINVAIQEDPNTNSFVKDLENLTEELFFDSNGKLTFKFDLLKDFAQFIPLIANKLDELKLPRIEQSDNDYDYILDNIILRCRNILPKLARVRTDTVFDSEQGKVANIVAVKMSKIQAFAQNVSFYYKKKSGIIRMEDAGLVSVKIPDNGLDLFFKLSPPVVSKESLLNENSKPQRAFKVRDVKCKVNDIEVELKHTSHDIIYKLFSRIVHSKIKSTIEEKITESIRNTLEELDSLIIEKINKSSSDQSGKEDWKSNAFETK